MVDVLDKNKNHISCLFPEILTKIFSYLDVRDKGRVCRVCVAWRDAAYNRAVWRGVEAKLYLIRPNPFLFPSFEKRGIRKVAVLRLKLSFKDVIFGINNIESLNISGCFNVNDESFSHALTREIDSLTSLNVSWCKQIRDKSLYKIASCLKNLAVLDLSGCLLITDHGLLWISRGLKKLRVLHLCSCHITDLGIGHLCGVLPDDHKDLEFWSKCGNFELEHLGLECCQNITDKALKHVSCGLLHLQSLDVSFCHGVSDPGIKYLSRMSCLKELNLRSCNNVSNTSLGYLGDGGSQLESIDVSSCKNIGDQGLGFLAQGMFKLKELSLGMCNITDDGLIRLVNSLSGIIYLDIEQCANITDKSLSAIGEKWKNLKNIYLFGCNCITTAGLEKIMKLPCLNTIGR